MAALSDNQSQQANAGVAPGAPDLAVAPVIEIRTVSKAFGEGDVLSRVTVNIARGEFFALLGGSGSGKTTLLRIIAGLETPDDGTVAICGIDMTTRPPYDRPVNMMFQSYALFPHLTVAANIEYGLRAVGTPRDERERLVEWALRLVHLEALARRKPDQLSGGQRQRVALARCLVKKPEVLLLDEPMAALDRGLREEMQRELVRIQRDVGTTFVLVTHDQAEAMSTADRIAVMDGGRIAQCGTPQEIYDYPATRFVAKFIGRTNLFEGHLVVDLPGTAEIACEGGLRIRIGHGVTGPTGMPCAAAVRPEKLIVSKRETRLANDFAGQIEALVYFGDSTRVDIRLASGRLVEATLINRDRSAADALQLGDAVYVGFDDTAAVFLSA